MNVEFITAFGEAPESDATLVRDWYDVAAALQTRRCQCDH